MSFGGGRGNGRDFNMDDFDFGGDSDETAAKTDENGESGQNAANQNGAPSGSGGQFPSFPGGGQFPGFSGSDGESGGFPSGGNFPSFPGSGSDQSGFPSDGNIPSFPDQSGESQGETDGTESGDSSEKGSRKGGFGGFGGGMGSDDVKLKYIDDDPDSYSNIFDNAKTEITKADKTRLIDSLEKLSSYTDLEEVLDTDEVLRYFVVHNFVCNGDSYTGMMIHNYYLHESDGKLSMIPWDYNLAFGTFRGGDASGTVNTSIDSPVSNGSADDRPMVGWIFSDESYTEQYHELFSQFIEKWFSDGELEKLIADTAEMIRPYVEKDPTKFCTTEEFDKGVTALSQFVSLRAEAVRNQLEGSDTEVDASSLNLSDMGSMGGGMGKGAGSFDIFSSIKLTAGDGSEISLSDIVEDTSALVSATLSDGTEIDLASSDMKNLMQTDFSKIVSVKDKNGNITNLSEYTVSVNMPGRSGSAPDISGNPDGAQQSDGGFTPPSENTEQNGDFSAPGGMSGSFTPPGGTADKSSFTGGSGEGEDTSSQGRTFPSSGGTPPDMSGGGTNSDMSFLLLTVLSVLILAVGIIIAVKKKH
ncbi:MAG: CotH kinase family protein [Clostridia bacterium]|nr:CotH kinase family protein [Clostridia bacterium]